nr:immunoglobulin heavy chain junction region [Macaca mulatta]
CAVDHYGSGLDVL